MHFTSLFLTLCLIFTVHSSPVCSAPGSQSQSGQDPTSIPADDSNRNSTITPSSGGRGRKMQVTVTGYGVCLTQGMACGLTGSPGKDPTAALSANLIPSYAKGNCGTCWKISNPRKLNYHASGTVPTIGGPLQSPKGDGMVVLINNSCSPGKDQMEPGAIGQCAQTDANPKDKLGSQSVLDLCSETDAVEMFFGGPKAGLAVADVEEVDCEEWSGTVRKVK